MESTFVYKDERSIRQRREKKEGWCLRYGKGEKTLTMVVFNEKYPFVER